jgi:hypothetical protein
MMYINNILVVLHSLRVRCGAMRFSPPGTPATIWPTEPAPEMDDDECGAIGGMAGRGHRSTRRKPGPVPLCPPQIQYDLTWARTRAVVVISRRLTRELRHGLDIPLINASKNCWIHEKEKLCSCRRANNLPTSRMLQLQKTNSVAFSPQAN